MPPGRLTGILLFQGSFKLWQKNGQIYDIKSIFGGYFFISSKKTLPFGIKIFLLTGSVEYFSYDYANKHVYI